MPSPASAWGFAAHRYIMRRAIEILPAELKPFFQQHRDEVVMRVVDPDLWRERGLGGRSQSFRRSSARRSSGRFRSRRLPREHGAALEKFGAAALKRLGTLPWREDEEFGNLRRAFEGFKRGSQPTGPATRCCLPSVASHYLQDAHQPFHASNNYDGQLTGQRGIHSRFERDLVEKFEARLTVAPAAPRAVPSARDAAFDALLASHQLVDPLLQADKEAIGEQGRLRR